MVSAKAIEGPRVAAALEAVDGEQVEDGDVLEGVRWTNGVPPGDVRELQVAASRISGVRLTGWEIDELTLLDTAVEGCELSGAVVSDGRWERVVFENCRMSGLAAAGLRARHVRFVDCKLDGAWLRGASFDHCEMVDCDLTGADLYGARLAASQLVRCTLDDAELSSVDADELALHGSTIVGTKGLASLQRLIVGSDQIVDLAIPLLAARQIRVDDDYFNDR